MSGGVPNWNATFDPDRLADLELRMWKAYYGRHRVRLLGLLVLTNREQAAVGWARALLAAFWFALAASRFSRASGDYDRFERPIARGYRALRLPPGIDAIDVARRELRWWVVRREIGLGSGNDAGAAISALYAALFGVPMAAVDEAAQLRGQAAEVRDRGAAAEPAVAPDEGAYWPEVARLLQASYRSLRDAVAAARGPPHRPARRGCELMDAVALLGLAGLLFVKEAGVPVPVPGDLLVLGAGVASNGDPAAGLGALVLILLAGYGGGSVQFLLARGALRRALIGLLVRLGIPLERLDALAAWLLRRGAFGVAVARASPGLRIGAITASGLAALPFRGFLLGARHRQCRLCRRALRAGLHRRAGRHRPRRGERRPGRWRGGLPRPRHDRRPRLAGAPPACRPSRAACRHDGDRQRCVHGMGRGSLSSLPGGHATAVGRAGPKLSAGRSQRTAPAAASNPRAAHREGTPWARRVRLIRLPGDVRGPGRRPSASPTKKAYAGRQAATTEGQDHGDPRADRG